MKIINFNKLDKYIINSIIEQIAFRKTKRQMKYLEGESLSTLYLYEANYKHIEKYINLKLKG